ncbi:MAG: hypothetical protein HC804_06310 [Anaerolineae bacterium]|nr:hypothetical protein [Anaerolineae bacterium]
MNDTPFKAMRFPADYAASTHRYTYPNQMNWIMLGAWSWLTAVPIPTSKVSPHV